MGWRRGDEGDGGCRGPGVQWEGCPPFWPQIPLGFHYILLGTELGLRPFPKTKFAGSLPAEQQT